MTVRGDIAAPRRETDAQRWTKHRRRSLATSRMSIEAENKAGGLFQLLLGGKHPGAEGRELPAQAVRTATVDKCCAKAGLAQIMRQRPRVRFRLYSRMGNGTAHRRRTLPGDPAESLTRRSRR